jgi:hypothetical protein
MVLGVPALGSGLVTLVDEEPVVGRVVASACLDQREAPAQLRAVQRELQLTLLHGPAGVVGLLRLERAPVPDDDVAGAVLAARDDAFEVEVLKGVVLDVNGHAPHGRIEGGPTGHRPTHEDAVDLQPEVIVKSRGAVALHDETACACRRGRGARRLRGPAEVPLPVIGLERHAALRLSRAHSLPVTGGLLGRPPEREHPPPGRCSRPLHPARKDAKRAVVTWRARGSRRWLAVVLHRITASFQRLPRGSVAPIAALTVPSESKEEP